MLQDSQVSSPRRAYRSVHAVPLMLVWMLIPIISASGRFPDWDAAVDDHIMGDAASGRFPGWDATVDNHIVGEAATEHDWLTWLDSEVEDKSKFTNEHDWLAWLDSNFDKSKDTDETESPRSAVRRILQAPTYPRLPNTSEENEGRASKTPKAAWIPEDA